MLDSSAGKPSILRVLLVLALAAGSCPAEAPRGRTPSLWAVVVGIDRYEDRAIPGCSGAVRDAREVKRWFQSAGWDARNILLLQDRGATTPVRPEDQVADLAPTRSNLSWAMKDWLGALSGPGDVVVFYFAGQAIGRPPEPGATPGTPGREYLLPSDARLADLDRSGWSIEGAIDGLASGGRNPVVCWLDTSLQGRAPANVAPAPAPRPMAGRSQGESMLGKLARWPGVTAWLAADGLPAAEAAGVGGRGPFVDALVRGLGRPDRPRNLLACLDAMNHDPALARQGFRMLGNIPAELSLWSKEAREKAEVPDRWLMQMGHGDRVTCAAFTADGGRLVTASMDSTVKVWRTTDRVLLRGLPDASHLQGVDALALGPDGRWLATGDGRGQVRFWDLAAGEPVEKPRVGPHPHRSRPTILAALPDGLHFVSADKDGECWLWDVAPRSLAPIRLARDVVAVDVALRPDARVALAVAPEGGPVRLFGPEGEPIRDVPSEKGTTTRLGLSPDGAWLALGDEEGGVRIWDVAEGKPTRQLRFDREVDLLAISATGVLVAGVGEALHLAEIAREGPPHVLPIPGRPHRVGFSADGRTLAACDRARGRVHVWRLGDRAEAEPVALEGAEAGGQAISLAFAPDGRTLAAGDQDGGIRIWDLAAGDLRARVPPRRGKVSGVSFSDDARHMLTISRDFDARTWDLKEGRGFVQLAGRWTAGAIAPDGSFFALARYPDGEIVVVDREGGRPRPTTFARPQARGGPGPATWAFGATTPLDGGQLIAISPDGRLIAACSPEGPLACVWDVASGRLRQSIAAPDHRDKLTAVAFSSDGRRLVTADAGGTTRLWELTEAGGRPRPLATFARPGETVTSARVDPGDSRRVATGTRAGRVLLWQEGRAEPTDHLRDSGPPVRAIVFSRDGAWLASAGEDKSVWAWSSGQLQRPIRLEPAHGEQVAALAAPGGGLIASGSDDATVRFWDLAGSPPSLLGTLAAVPTMADRPPPPGDKGGGGSDGGGVEGPWVLFTPEGLFDCSPGAGDRVTLLRRDEVLPLGNFAPTHLVLGLGDRIRQGQAPDPPRAPENPPPIVAMDSPTRPVQRGKDRDVLLTASLGTSDFVDARLYQNGIPIRDETGLDRDPGGRRLRAKVRLRGGVNRFYLMAGRPGSADGRSNEVEVRYDGPDNPGLLHVVALGVSEYRGRPLQFAHRDAERIAAHLEEHGLDGAGAEGERIVLLDKKVTRERVDEAFRRLKEKVKDRPQDTIVVFLAGHTDVIANRFCLLLPDFPFPDGPAAGPDLLATRGPLPGEARPAVVDENHVLPYSRIYGQLARADALNRLVIVDACQAGAVLDDEGVRTVQRRLEDGTHRARTTYILASRRGEPADEATVLKHGLLTYALLRGMGAEGLEALPDASIFDRIPTADGDGDGVITSGELREFADRTLPGLAGRFPALTRRAGGGPIPAGPSPHVRGMTDVSFPLVTLPDRAR